MDAFKNEMLYEKLKEEAFTWIGTPYGHFKKERGIGADCALFINEIFVTLKIIRPIEYDYHDRFWFTFRTREIILEQINTSFKQALYQGFSLEEKTSDCKRGDLLTFAMRSKLTNHIALYLEGDQIIHSLQRCGVCIHGFTDEYKSNQTHCYRIVQL